MYCHNGGLARTVEDMRLFQNVLAGPHPMDHRSLRPKLELPADPGDIRGLRIAVTTDFGGCFPVDADVARNTLAAADALRAAGATVEEIPLAISTELVFVARSSGVGGLWRIEHAPSTKGKERKGPNDRTCERITSHAALAEWPC